MKGTLHIILFSFFLLTSLRPFAQFSQSIDIAAGWNYISSYTNVDDMTMEVVLDNVAGDLVLVKNILGEVYIPSNGFNQIGQWDILDGYSVKAAAAATLTMCCDDIDPATPILLEPGWSLVSYLPQVNFSADTALATVADRLLIAKDENGLVYLPSVGFNGIGDMVPGQGYQLKLSEAGVLIYPGHCRDGLANFDESAVDCGGCDCDPCPGAVVDIDGNVYATVQIGSQLWMAQNLRTTRYNNGDPIANITGDSDWFNATTPAQSSWNNDSSNDLTFGRYYNWYAGADPRNICPCGWHMPSITDFVTLRNTLGGNSVAGGKMKVTGFVYWNAPNEGATNSSGFSARGAGNRSPWDGRFDRMKIDTFFWTTAQSGSYGYYWEIRWLSGSLNPVSFRKNAGQSIRCVKD